MRFAYGTLAFFIWGALFVYMVRHGVVVSDDTALLATAIVVAGAMAGGG